MNRIIANPFANNLQAPVPSFQVEGLGHTEADRTRLVGYGRAIVRTLLFLVLAAAGFALIVASLMPILLVMFLMFLPVLAPVLLVILGVLMAEEVEVPSARAHEDGPKPCSCHRDQANPKREPAAVS